MSSEYIGSMIRESVKKFGASVAMRYKENDVWKQITYNELGELIRDVAKALLEYDMKEGEMVGIFAQNMPQWSIADFGILSVRGVSVPIYATNTAKQAEYIVNDAEIRVLFVGDKVQYDKITSFIDSSKYLKKIIVFDEKVQLKGAHSVYLKDFLELGKKSAKDSNVEERLERGSVDDIATLIYTSGTTGDPKGAILTHGNFAHQMRAIDERFSVGVGDRSLCFLPLSHAYERTWSYYVFRTGAENNYLADQKKIVEFMPDVKPTAMVSVPRLYEKIYSTVFDRLKKASPAKAKLFHWALRTGKAYQYKKKDRKFIGPWLVVRHALADALVLKKIRDVVGGQKNFFSAGGAPLSIDIEEFFFAAGLLVCQGYGLTESSPMISCNAPGAFKFGTVGRPIKDCEVKIDDTGEILARGGNIMKGYYKKPEATAETLVDGWLKTGDVGIIDEDGFLKITDRIKDLIITSQGKNIAPQHIETLVGMDHYIEQIATIGDKRKFVTALIVPSFPALEQWAKEKNISFSSREELVKHPDVIKFYEKRIADQSKELANYEKIKRFTLMATEFTQDGGELTPTMKIKRKVVGEKYKDLIDSMYADAAVTGD